VARLVLKGKTMEIAVFEPVVEEAPGLRAPLAAYQAAYRALATGLPEAGARFAMLARDFPDDPLVNLHFRRLRAGEHGVLITMTEK
jgi:adenylate cyclase